MGQPRRNSSGARRSPCGIWVLEVLYQHQADVYTEDFVGPIFRRITMGKRASIQDFVSSLADLSVPIAGKSMRP